MFALRHLFPALALSFLLAPEASHAAAQHRGSLVDLFGMDKGVRSERRRDFAQALAHAEKVRVIGGGLAYSRRPRIDRAVRDLLGSTTDDAIALGCLKHLLGRGFDADIERYCRRRLPDLTGQAKAPLEAMLAKMGWTALHVAVERDEGQRVCYVAKGARADASARNGCMPLHLAAVADNEGLISLLLAARPNLHGKGPSGLTAVQLAAQAGHYEAVRRLVERGAAVPDIWLAIFTGKGDRLADFLKADASAVALRRPARVDGALSPISKG